MKRVWNVMQVIAGLALLAAFALVLVGVFQALSGGGAAGVPGAAQPPQVTLATQPPEGYPPPGATLPPPATLSAPEVTAMIAQATASASVPLPTPGPLIGPQTISNSDGQFSLNLPSGWSALVGGSMSIVNYDYAEAEKLGTFPPGGLGIQIGVVKLPEGQTFEQWQAKWIALETSPDVAGAGAVASHPSPYQLGQYTGSTFTITGPFPSVMEIDLLSEGQIVIIGLAPADSPALQEALAMLSTLEIFSKPKP